jgi:hypothetical protein
MRVPSKAEFAREHREFLRNYNPKMYADLQSRAVLSSTISSVAEQAEEMFHDLMDQGRMTSRFQNLPHPQQLKELKGMEEEALEHVRDQLILQPRD